MNRVIGHSIADDSAGVKEISEEIDGGFGKTGKIRGNSERPFPEGFLMFET